MSDPSTSCQKKRKVHYISSKEYVEICNLHPKVYGRSVLVNSLLEAYDLFDKMVITPPKMCTQGDLLTFHTKDYITCLQSIESYFKENSPGDMKEYKSGNIDHTDLLEDEENDITSHGFGYDCEVFPNLYSYTKFVAGATMTAADALLNKECDIAVNLNGGWHHAHVDEAAGFCYINDIVIGILHLLKQFKRILYIDFDIHHGDGVEEAFKYSKKVFTLSLHRYHKGFFPGTGDHDDIGLGAGEYYTCNIPLKSSIKDHSYVSIFKDIFQEVNSIFKPDVIVCQCGADMLNGDPLGDFNLTETCLSDCLQIVTAVNVPMLILGGGGYNLQNTAKCWVKMVASLLNETIDENIPEHDFLETYGPDFSLCISPGNRKDENTESYLTELMEEVTDNLQQCLLDIDDTRADDSNKVKEKFSLKRTMNNDCDDDEADGLDGNNCDEVLKNESSNGTLEVKKMRENEC